MSHRSLGCGKSTVLSMLAGLQDVTTGGVILAGQGSDRSRPDRGVVFQSPCLLPWFSALRNVLLGVNEVFPRKPPPNAKPSPGTTSNSSV